MNGRDIFLHALDMPDASDRAAYLDRACGDDATLRGRIEFLLRQSENLDTAEDRPFVSSDDFSSAAEDSLPVDSGELPTQDESQKRVLGDYRIVRELGRGGMGVVYEAEQISLGRRVALKVLPLASILNPTQLTRFRNEARAAASLNHPNVVQVYSVGIQSGVHYYAMRMVKGQTVAELIRILKGEFGLDSDENGQTSGFDLRLSRDITFASHTSSTVSTTEFPAHVTAETDPGDASATDNDSSLGAMDHHARSREVAELMVQAADALEHAHRMGVVHRDIKPSNIMVDDAGVVHITDFGLAIIEADHDMTVTGNVMGTLPYMSPEQIRGERHVLDHRTDIYSLGATMYEMLTLRPAFDAADMAELVPRIGTWEPIVPRKINSAIPRDLEIIVMKAMAKEPRERYSSAGEMAEDLRRFLRYEPIHARPPALHLLVRKWARRHRPIVVTASVTLAIAVIIAGVLLWNQRGRTLNAFAAEKRQRQIAVANETQARRKADEALRASRAAEKEAAKSQAVVELIRTILHRTVPDGASDGVFTVRDLLDGFTTNLDGTLDNLPEVEMELHSMVGETYLMMQLHEDAEPHLQKAIALNQDVLGEDPSRLAIDLRHLAACRAGQEDLAGAETAAREALAVCRRGSVPPDQTLLAYGLLVELLIRQERLGEAEPLIREGNEFARRHELTPDAKWNRMPAEVERLRRLSRPAASNAADDT